MRPVSRALRATHSGLALLLVAGAIGFSQLSLAQEKVSNAKDETKSSSNATKSDKKSATKSSESNTAVAPELETAALDFAQQNHPELVSVLLNLKANNPKKYQAALVELSQTIDRLAKIKDPSRHESQLMEWKFSSRIRLLAVRQAVSDDPAVEGELQAVLRERLEFRLASQRADLDRLQKRVAKLQESVDSMTNNADALISKELSDVKKSMPVTKASRTKAKRAADVAPVDKSGEK